MNTRLLQIFALTIIATALWDMALFRFLYPKNAEFLNGILSGESYSREAQLAHYARLNLADKAYFGLNMIICTIGLIYVGRKSSKYRALVTIPVWILGVWLGTIIASVSPWRLADYQALAITTLVSALIFLLVENSAK